MRRRGATSALRSSLVLASFLCLGVGLVGFNPYVRNTVEKGHPFYPILGEHRIDIMSINMDSTFGAKVRLEKFQESLLGRSSVQFHLERGRIPPKIPFTFTRAEFESVSTPDPRVAGFGPLFGGILILSLSVGMASFALLFLRRHSGAPSAWRIPTGGKSDLWLLIGLVAASALANPELWWARYVPQLWTLPLLVALGLGGPLSDRVGLATRWVVVAAMLLTGFASLGIGAFQGARSSMVVERDLMRLESSRTPLTVYYGVRTGDRLKYLDRPISVRPVDQIDSLEGKFRDTLLCGGIIQYDDSELHASFHQHGKGLQVNGALLHRFVSDRLVPFL